MKIKSFQHFITFLLIIVSLSAVAGGLSLLTPEHLGIPVSDLEGSIFSSYFWPGVILAVVVGGMNLLAAGVLILKNKFDLEITAAAGFALTIWIFVEICIVGYHSWLQSLYFGLGNFILIAVMTLLKYRKVNVP